MSSCTVALWIKNEPFWPLARVLGKVIGMTVVLPAGSGTPKQGEAVYTAKCVACHGEKGAGRPNDALVGGIGSLPGDKPPMRTVGSYWPYATTIFDYVRRAMPYNESKSLTNDEVYAVTAYILQLNGIIGENDVTNAQTLPKVRMTPSLVAASRSTSGVSSRGAGGTSPEASR